MSSPNTSSSAKNGENARQPRSQQARTARPHPSRRSRLRNRARHTQTTNLGSVLPQSKRVSTAVLRQQARSSLRWSSAVLTGPRTRRSLRRSVCFAAHRPMRPRCDAAGGFDPLLAVARQVAQRLLDQHVPDGPDPIRLFAQDRRYFRGANGAGTGFGHRSRVGPLRIRGRSGPDREVPVVELSGDHRDASVYVRHGDQPRTQPSSGLPGETAAWLRCLHGSILVSSRGSGR